jgi:hypothetical protein
MTARLDLTCYAGFIVDEAMVEVAQGRRWTRARFSRWALGAAFALAGSALGSLVTGRSSHACSCADPSWSLRRTALEQAILDEKSKLTTHEEHWPTEALLMLALQQDPSEFRGGAHWAAWPEGSSRVLRIYAHIPEPAHGAP